jgi:hypothetical protein
MRKLLDSMKRGLAQPASADHGRALRFQGLLFLTAFVLRLAASVAVYQGGLIRVIGAGDDDMWVSGAALHDEWVRQGKGILNLPADFAASYQTHHDGYVHLLAVLFHFAPPVRQSAAALNAFLAALATVLVYRTAREFASDRAAQIAGGLTCVFPSLIVWSALTIKEPVVLFLSVLALHSTVHIRVHGLTLRHLAALVASVMLLVPFRFYAAYVTTAAVLLGLVLPRLDRQSLGARSRLGAMLFAAILLGTGVLKPHGGEFEQKFEDLSLKNIQSFRGGIGYRRGSSVPPTNDVRTTAGFCTQLTVGATHLLLAPLPWQTGGGGLRVYLAFPEMVVWWCLLPTAVVPGLWHTLRRRFDDVLPVLIFVVGLGAVYSLLFANIGLIFRQRSQLLPWLLAFAAVGIEQRLHARHTRRAAKDFPEGCAHAGNSGSDQDRSGQ